MKKLSDGQKAQRIVQPLVAAGERRKVVSQATGRVVARSAVTGRYVSNPSKAAASGARKVK